MINEIILKIEKVNKHYYGEKKDLHIIKNLDWEVKKGEFVSIVGRSGSGKSTFLNLVGILDQYDSGDIFYEGKNISFLKENQRDFLRNEMLGFVFQFHYLLPEFTAVENVMIPGMLKNKKIKKLREKAVNLLEEVGLAHRLDHKPAELSGGEKQRVAIARALINDPKMILADELTGNLDDETSSHIHEILIKLNKERKQTIVVVTHNDKLANLADKKYLLEEGKLKEVF